MPNENQLIAEYDALMSTTLAAFYGQAAADAAAMRADVDPRAVAMHWLKELVAEGDKIEEGQLVKALALQQLQADAKAILAELAPPPKIAYTHSEKKELERMVATGTDGVCYKGGEIYLGADFRV